MTFASARRKSAPATKVSKPLKAHAPQRIVTSDGAAGRRTTTVAKSKMPVKVGGFRNLLRIAPLAERVRIEREGVPYQVVKGLINEIGVTTSEFQRLVGIPKATFIKKMNQKAQFAGTTGQSVVGLMELINKVEDMLDAEQDNPEARNFDVEKWVGDWIQRPQPALGGLAPAELMDTPSGRESIMRVLGAIQSGAYQ